MEQYIIARLFAQPCATTKQGKHYIWKYIKLIEQLSANKLNPYQHFENHHIVPQSWDDSLINDPNNIIAVTTKAHIVLHHLLAKTKDRSQQIAFHNIIFMRGITQYFNYNVTCNLIAEAKKGMCRRVMNLDTGEVYESIAAASKAAGTLLQDPIRKHYRGGGYYWAYMDDVLDQSRESLLEIYHQKEQRNKQRLLDLRKPVVNLNTGRVYESMSAVQNALGLKSGITASIKERKRIRGCFYQYLDVVQQTSIEFELKACLEARKSKLAKAVVNLNTGQVFDSISDAIKSVGGHCNIVSGIKIT